MTTRLKIKKNIETLLVDLTDKLARNSHNHREELSSVEVCFSLLRRLKSENLVFCDELIEESP